mmetsp:Transcript_36613/g.89436  ORF Transcript_36613/g.89436 Transcript_36613/m.89436 type:complete len:251 (+) Transcript_36613:567-1319(+)
MGLHAAVVAGVRVHIFVQRRRGGRHHSVRLLAGRHHEPAVHVLVEGRRGAVDHHDVRDDARVVCRPAALHVPVHAAVQEHRPGHRWRRRGRRQYRRAVLGDLPLAAARRGARGHRSADSMEAAARGQVGRQGGHGRGRVRHRDRHRARRCHLRGRVQRVVDAVRRRLLAAVHQRHLGLHDCVAVPAEHQASTHGVHRGWHSELVAHRHHRGAELHRHAAARRVAVSAHLHHCGARRRRHFRHHLPPVAIR